MRSASLLGRQHLELGVMGVIAEGRAAIALSRGGAPKLYFHTDPNEDAVCFAEGEGGGLLAVADGHHGFAASECAIQYLLEAHAEKWTAAQAPFRAERAWRDAACEAVAGANQAILAQAAERRLPPAHTTLSLALVRPDQDRLIYASMGDSHIFQATGDEIRELGWNRWGSGRNCYLGYVQMGQRPEPHECLADCEPLGRTSALVLATDGLSEHRIGVEDPESAVRDALEAIGEVPPELRPLHACKRLTQTALAAQQENQSGDNVACALFWLAA